MDIASRIEALINASGKSTHKVLMDCKIPSSALAIWRNGKAKPSADALNKIADYFNVSVDYLMGRAEPQNPPPAATGISIARGGRVEHFTLSEERLKYLEDLIKTLEKDEKKK